MDAQAGIAWNVEALKRILVSLVAMAGMGAAFTSPLWGGRREASGGGDVQTTTPTPNPSPQGEGEHELRPTLPRHLHRAVLRLLRPAESAARRLIIAAALATTPQARDRETIVAAPRPQKAALRQRRHFMPAMPVQPAVRPALSRLALPLTDPLTHPFRRAPGRQAVVPRLWIVGSTEPRPALPVPPAPDDPLDATRLRLRLAALGRALDDLPGEALRFSRWRARRAAFEAGQSRAAAGVQERMKLRFRWPLRPGRPPGSSPAGEGHAVQAVLAHAHALGWWALQQPADTS